MDIITSELSIGMDAITEPQMSTNIERLGNEHAFRSRTTRPRAMDLVCSNRVTINVTE